MSLLQDLSHTVSLYLKESSLPHPWGQRSAPLEMSDEDLAKNLELDGSEGVDVSAFKDGPKKSILNLVSQRNDERAKNKALQSSIDELKKEGESSGGKYTELETVVSELKQRLGFHEVSETNEYKERISVPRDEVTRTLSDIAIQYGIDPAEVTRAIAMPIKQRIEFFKEKYPDYLSATGYHFSVLDRLSVVEKDLREKHPQILSDHRASMEKQQIAQASQQAQDQTDRLTYMLDQSVKGAQRSNIPFFVKNGEADHDKVVDGVLKKSKEVLMGNDPNAIMGYAVIGASIPAYHESLSKANARVAELESKLSGLQKATPGSKGEAASPGKPKVGKNMSTHEWVESLLNKQ